MFAGEHDCWKVEEELNNMEAEDESSYVVSIVDGMY